VGGSGYGEGVVPVILPDLNLLLYAYNPHTPQYAAARRWWEGAMNGEELIGLPFEVSFGFIRVATNPRLAAAQIPLADFARFPGLAWEKPRLPAEV